MGTDNRKERTRQAILEAIIETPNLYRTAKLIYAS